MGLLKKIKTDFGIEAEYWHIGAKSEDFKGGGCEVTLYGYISEAARVSGAQPLTSGVQQIAGESYIPDATREQLYAILKSTEAWLDAQDC